mgnify:CR=1 FL=1
MSSALSAAVSGLKAHQTMLDVAGNNLANVNTTAYKSSSVTFAELLSQNIRGASGPAGNLGGTNFTIYFNPRPLIHSFIRAPISPAVLMPKAWAANLWASP